MAQQAQQVEKRESRDKKVDFKIALVPVYKSDHPIFSNFTRLKGTNENVFIEFGFLKPGSLEAFIRITRSGGDVPDVLTGRLAVSVVMGYEAAVPLYRQLGKLIAARRARGVAGPRTSKGIENSVRGGAEYCRPGNSPLPSNRDN